MGIKNGRAAARDRRKCIASRGPQQTVAPEKKKKKKKRNV
jgi:hypothetical protein